MKIGQMSVVAGILLGLVWVGCSKKSNPAGPEENKNLPPVGIQEIVAPEHMTQSSDPNAQMAVNYIRMANGFASFSYAFTPPNGLAKSASLLDGPTWRRTWTHDGLTITLSVYDRGEQYVWETRLDGKDKNFSYSNWLFMKIEEAKDGKSGTMTVYKPVTTAIEAQWNWGTNANDTRVVTYLLEDGNEGMKIAITQNSDQSGSLKFFEKSAAIYKINFECQWTKEGTGEYKQYQDGTVLQSGTWG